MAEDKDDVVDLGKEDSIPPTEEKKEDSSPPAGEKNEDEPLEVDWKGMFVTGVLVVILVFIFWKLVLPAMVPTIHSPTEVIKESELGGGNYE